jgi:aspartyl-tRNA(Asn)/glutamyl-tRNA(Gln) amidotransferase subunit A
MAYSSTTTTTAVELSKSLQEGQITAEALVLQTLETIEVEDKRLNAFLALTKDLALQTAQAVDKKRQAGETLSPWAGVPIAVKDNLNVQGYRTTCGSKMLENYISPYNATVVEHLLKHQLPIVGKTNMDEFAMGSSTENSAYQKTRNPWDTNRVPGGSSGGSAVAVSAGWVPWSLGSDTGGSVRQPASLCGLVGLKPTYGLLSRFGLVAYASSLDQVSPFARTVEDVAALLDCIASPDPKDMTCLTAEARPKIPYLESLKQTPAKLRVGVISELNGEGMQAEVQDSFKQAVATFEALGAEVSTLSVAGIREAIAAYYIIAPSEASSNLARFDGVRYGLSVREGVSDIYDMFRKTRAQGFGPEVKRRIMVGTFALSSGYYDAYYGKAQKARWLLKQSFLKAFAEVDVLICPTSPTTAFELGSKADDPITMYLSDIATIPVNLAGIPALSVPCGFDAAGLPMGLQLLGPALSESLLLQVAHAFEQRCGLKNLIPELAAV